MKTVLVLGATGHFGARISRRLAGDPRIRTVLSSRSLDASTELAKRIGKSARDANLRPAALDLEASSFEADLAALEPHVVIHTAGPYQGQDYRVAKACLACGCDYIDLADGRAFVEEFARLGDEAERKGVLLVSGASTLPGLSSAVVSAVSQEFSEITGIETVIAPAHRTPRGRGTIAAVMSYCGKPFLVLEDGAWRTRYGWQDLRLRRYPGLGRRFAGACDVPDLFLLPAAYPALRTATFHASLEAFWEQLSLWLMAAMARIGLVGDWSRYAGGMAWLGKRLQGLGSDRGGMFMSIRGLDRDGKDRTVDWNLRAGSNHGPEIPCTPALVLVRKRLRGELPVRGAMPCMALFTLAEFAAELEGFDVSWSFERR
ncbi:MAG: saccharopine dehydrogenase family protein [Burkholderiales bacterium]